MTIRREPAVGGAPRTVRIDRSGRVLERLTPEDLYAGMPSISQQTPLRLAFPGQPAVPPYNQQNNRIYIGTSPTEARKSSSPMASSGVPSMRRLPAGAG